MILYDKAYIRTPKDNASLMHYLGLTQFISILARKTLMFLTSFRRLGRTDAAKTLKNHRKTQLSPDTPHPSETE